MLATKKYDGKKDSGFGSKLTVTDMSMAPSADNHSFDPVPYVYRIAHQKRMQKQMLGSRNRHRCQDRLNTLNTLDEGDYGGTNRGADGAPRQGATGRMTTQRAPRCFNSELPSRLKVQAFMNFQNN